MRQNLLRTFNEIYLLDLHGNANKKERSPDGSEDKNVFDIMEGVAIVLCVKQKGNPKLARIHHAHLWGTRESKYRTLQQFDVSITEWTEFEPVTPLYLFVPQDTNLRAEYEKGWKTAEAFPENLLGFQTHRDPIAVSFDEAGLKSQVAEYLGKIPSQSDWDKYCHVCDYRPFDRRFVYLHKSVTDRPRLNIEQHLFLPNLALNLVRQTKADEWRHAVVSRRPTPAIFVELKDGSNVFPLYLHFASDDELPHHSDRSPNLSPAFLKTVVEKLKQPQVGPDGLPKDITPEDIFHYAYAVFHSPTYRTRYVEFLKNSFPRLPLTGDLRLFLALSAKGAELVALHLLESPKLNDFLTDWPVKGDNVVEKVQYTDNDKRVWINKTQYFGGVPEAVWEFHIGGYQVCQKWLKDRKGRKLHIPLRESQ